MLAFSARRARRCLRRAQRSTGWPKAATTRPVTAAIDVVLASASPRRKELLERLGLRLQVVPAAIDETPRPDEHAADYVRRMAAEKCAAVATGAEAALPVLAADTIVVADRQILGKPTGPDDAAGMLRRLAGRRHEVTTAYRVQRGSAAAERAVSTTVAFRLIAPAEIDAYVASGEWEGKAGGYAIQGIAAVFATEIRGSLTNVIGLPLAEVIADLRAVGGLASWPPAGFGCPP
jgi:septum formation protein